MAFPILRRSGSSLPVRSMTPSGGVSRIDPWNDLTAMDRLFENLFRGSFTGLDRAGAQGVSPAEPQLELYETADDLIAFLYAPGLDGGSLDISASADSIGVRAERKPLIESTDHTLSHTPWSGLAAGGGAFSATYRLPSEIDTAKVQATYKDGVLQLKMPKSDAAKPKQVKVEVNQA